VVFRVILKCIFKKAQMKTIKFIEKSFKNGEISDLGVDFREILPKSSLFATKNAEQNERVFSLLKGFYEKYRDISGSQI